MLLAAARAVRRFSLAAAAALVLLAFVDGGVALVRGTVRAPIDLAWGAPPLAALRAESGVGPASPNAMWDVATQMIPWRSVVARAYAAGEWPLWNPYAAAGEPLAGTGQSAPYHPLLLLSLLLAAPQALSYLAATKLFVAALAMFLLARELALDERVALVVAAGWAFCGYVHAFQGWPIGYVAGAFPLLLLGARRAVRRPGAASSTLLLVAFTLTLLAGHPESAIYALTGAGAWFAAELVLARRRGLGPPLATGAAAAVAALGLTALFWLPFADTVFGSAEHAARQGPGAELRALPWSEALTRLRPQVVPFAAGLPIYGVPRPALRYAETVGTAFPGAVLLGAAAYGLAAGRRRWRVPLAAATIAGLALAVRVPGPVDLLRELPLFDVALTRDAKLWPAMAILLAAGFGLERALQSPGARRLGLALLGTTATLGLLVAAWWPAILASGLPPELARRHALVLLAAGAAAAAMALARPRPALWLPLLLGLVLVERRLESGALAHRFAAEHYFPLVAPLDRLPAGGAPFRLVAEDQGVLPPNFAAVYGLEDLRSYNALTLPRFAELARLWHVPGQLRQRAIDLDTPVLAVLDARFALVRGCGGSRAGWRERACAHGLALLERERSLGRAFVPPRVRWGGRAADRLRWLAEGAELERIAWLDRGEADGPPRELDNGDCRVIAASSGFRPRLTTRCATPGWVVVSMSAWPGWRARAGGRDLPVAFADHALLAFEAPAGEAAVELLYRPRAFVLGRAVSALTAAALLSVGIGIGWRRRRAGAGPVSRPSRASA